jgi:hypothetical protein
MSCSMVTRSSVCCIAPALLAICLMGSLPARAAEPATAPEVAAASVDSREATATVRDRSSLSTAQPEQILTGPAPTTAQEPARLDRPPARARRTVRREEERVVRRDQERAQLRFRREVAAAIPWHRSMGVILGVGF